MAFKLKRKINSVRYEFEGSAEDIAGCKQGDYLDTENGVGFEFYCRQGSAERALIAERVTDLLLGKQTVATVGALREDPALSVEDTVRLRITLEDLDNVHQAP